MNQIGGTWNAPMDSSGRDPVVGRTEWGAPIYRSALGHTYWREPKRPGYEKNALKLRDMLAMHGDGPRRPVEYETTRQAPDGVSQPTLGGAMGGIRDMIMSGLSAPRRALEGQPVTNGEVMNAALDWGMMTAPMSAPKGALRAGGMVDDAPKGIKAYHGSPHDFDRFSMDKIGTGEGAQAYGHGLYFAENEGVAQGYKQALQQVDLGPFDEIGIPPKDWNAARMFAQNMDPTQADIAARDFAQWTGRDATPELVEAFRRAKKPGHLYEVNINANPDDFLDWDSGGEAIYRDTTERLMRERGVIGLNAEAAAERGAAQELARQGIPGIKYLDAGSRGAGTGTRNYVVFDENLISILRKYGIGAMVPGAGYMLNDDEYSSVEMLQ